VLLFLGRSGTGKSYIITSLVENYGFVESVSCTSRPIRPNEKEGIDYYFITEEEFKNKIDNGEIYEWTCTKGNYYGTPRENIKDLSKLIIDIDLVGFERIKKDFEDERIVSIYLYANDEERLRRMKRRGESQEEIEKRFKIESEYKYESETYDFIIDTTKLTKEEVYEEVVKELKSKEII